MRCDSGGRARRARGAVAAGARSNIVLLALCLAGALYGSAHAGVEIYEYHTSFLHSKVAVIDWHWATVGSSNIDPFSLMAGA